MSRSVEPLRENEVGPFGELSTRPNPAGLVIVTVPPFELMLTFIERRIGRKLNSNEIENEIEAERSRAVCIVLSQEAAQKMAAARASRP